MRNRAELYQLKHGARAWYFTDQRKAITHAGIKYLPIRGLQRTAIEDESIDKTEVEVTFPFPFQILNESGDDFQQTFIDKIYFESVTLTILELCKNETLAIFNGRVTQPKFNTDENVMTLVCSTSETYQNRNILTRKFQKPCANKIYDRFCGLNFDDWAVSVTVTAIDGVNISFRVNPTPVLDENGDPVLDVDGNPTTEIKIYPIGYFNRGLLLKNGVYTSVLSSGIDAANLYRKHKGLQVGSIIKIAPACDQTRKSCHEKFNNNLRFMGFPDIPNDNPLTTQIVR